MRVLKERLKSSLDCYKEDYIFLQSVEYNFPFLEGEFQIGPNFYFPRDLNHFTAIEAQFCFNQLAYVGIGEFISRGMINCIDLTYDQFLEKRANNIFILDHHTRFKKELETSEIIKGNLELKSHKILQDSLWLFCDYSFGDEAVVGGSKCVVKLS